MEYYALVERIKEKHECGVYGRRVLKKEEKREFKDYNKSEKAFFIGNIILSAFQPVIGGITIVITAIDQHYNRRTKNELSVRYKLLDAPKQIIFDNDYLENDYNIAENNELFYGIFDNYVQKNKIFESIMKSNGGSRMTIIARNEISSSKHFGGEDGKFNYGLYCSHPKDENLLIPLENSNELIKTMILEETLRAYEALGAKKILIEDHTEVQLDSKQKAKNLDAGASVNFKKEVLREKEFGKGTFDAERALKSSLFIHDFPNIMTTINGRVNGNQISERFTETINLSTGLDINVLKIISGNVNFEYKRKWYFEVTFYDKNE
ncbi:hypothetical protein [Flavobacterium sp.]|uniref:hypothetical protein n=1 Tax=Flavobacterium sp. TaxID=239 RepID=UPI0026392094|nr:hypothetical protein [Flavobacterium sp.]